MTRTIARCALAFIAALPLCGNIVTVDQSDTTGHNYDNSESSYGQSFTPTLNEIDAVQFAFNGNASVQVQLFAGAGNSGALLASVTQNVNVGCCPFVEFDFTSNPVTLTPGQTYTFWLKTAPNMDVEIDQSGSSYPGGAAYFSGRTGGSTDLEFVEGLTHAVVSTPEPTHLSLLLSLLGFTFFAVIQFRPTNAALKKHQSSEAANTTDD